MISLLLTWILSAVGLLLTTYIVPGFIVNSLGSALLAVVIIGFFNMLLKPLLLLLTLPINILTLGLFTFVINAIILKIAASLLDGFIIETWFAAIVGAIVLAIIHAVLFALFKSKKA